MTLDSLRTAAAARRKPTEHPDAPTLSEAWETAEADLDAALELLAAAEERAKRLQLAVDESADLVARCMGLDALDKAQRANLIAERDKAREQIDRLAEELRLYCSCPTHPEAHDRECNVCALLAEMGKT